MLNLGDKYKTDPELDEKGVWFTIDGGARVLVARSNNPGFQKEYMKLNKVQRDGFESGRLEEEDNTHILCDLLSRKILLDWEGIGHKGKIRKYTQKDAYEFLKEYNRFRDMIWQLASDEEGYYQAGLGNDIKNSPAASDGT